MKTEGIATAPECERTRSRWCIWKGIPDREAVSARSAYRCMGTAELIWTSFRERGRCEPRRPRGPSPSQDAGRCTRYQDARRLWPIRNFEFSLAVLGFGTLLVMAAALTGCTSKSEAKAREHAAFVAGREEVLMRLQQARDTNVTLIGPVRNPVVHWTEDLTLAKALVTAGYQSRRNPREIIILRGGQAIPVDPNQLLNGEDVPLQAGDRVEIRE